MKAEATVVVKESRAGLGRLRAIGPGLVMVLAGLGPRDIVSNSIAGSTAGYSLIWTLVLALVIRVIMHDASARYTLVKGESVLAGTGKLNRWAVFVWMGATVLRRHVGALVNITLLGTAANLVFPLPTRHSIAIWGLISWCSGFALLYWGRYRAIEKLSRPLTVAMGCAW
jgi:Mn2+/Fe2+ NRAMP family transporter